ncbi:anaerobic ribonucleoside-triphosphate reductase activating protein [Deltaproteobacteria bacterium]|nr:anaerobic ribonucleoside-triphosphate reductase activating protein [Deltaproteobacteria bacterium]
MHFGGIQKNSFIDYPGKVSCVVFLSGCNFDCPYCHNPSLVRGGSECTASLNYNGLYDFLKSRRTFLDGVVISGGEPTLHEDLGKLCEAVKELGYPIKLDTNGSRPRELKRLIRHGLVDYIAMDIKTDPSHYQPFVRDDYNPEDILTSIVTIMELAPDYEFRTTCVKRFVDERVIEKIAKLIKNAKLYALQKFNKSELLHPEFFRDSESWHSEEDLINLKRIAEPWVRECMVR